MSIESASHLIGWIVVGITILHILWQGRNERE